MKMHSLILAAVLSLLIAPSAFAHASLQTSAPKSGEVVAGTPKEIVLNFNEALEAPFSKITLKDGKGGTLKTDPTTVDKAHPQTLHLMTPKLAVGSYQVLWSTMTQDGHRAKGQYGFQVK